MIKRNNINNYGVSPIIGVVLLIALFTAVVSLLSYNIFSTGVGKVDELYDIDTNINVLDSEDGINVSILQNENIDELIIKHDNGNETKIDKNESSTVTIKEGPGKYQIIGNKNGNKKILRQKRINNQILNINAPDNVVTNEDITYNITTNFDSTNIESYNWDFGNGDTSVEETPTMNYSETGTYTTKITIEYDNEIITKEKYINVD